MDRVLAQILVDFIRFRRDRDGSLTIMALFFFICMIMIGGLSVDIMVFENNRTRLQNLSDRAVLAAADMDQNNDPEEVVRSYFEKEGMLDKLDHVKATSGLLARSVSVQTSNPMRTMFMNMTGVTQMTPRGSATATEGQGDLEIVMVLDVSNSMNNASTIPGIPTKLDDLKRAAKRFVDVVYAQSENDNITITLVPFNTQVNAGRDALEIMGVEMSHSDSFCLEFDDVDFTTPMVNWAAEYDQTAHFDQWYSSEDPVVNVCRAGSNREIKFHQNDPETIKSQIDALDAHGNTSAEIGLKWAATVLDPSSRALTQALATRGKVPSSMADRPLDYGTDGSQKVVVLLSDGKNTDQKRIRPEFLKGNSPVYEIINLGNGIDDYSADMKTLWNFEVGSGPDAKKYWTKAGKIGEVAWNDTFSKTSAPHALLTALGPSIVNPKLLKWEELWQKMNPRHLAYQFIADATEENSDAEAFLNTLWTNVSGPMKDARLKTLCDRVDQNGVAVYTIGFEIDDHGKSVLSDCASGPNTFVNVVGDDLEDTFVAIATSISKLRLTQ